MAGGQGINVGSIVADLQVDSTHLERGLANARKALDAVEAEFKNLDYALNKNRISLMDYTERVMALNRTEALLASSMNTAYTATTKIDTGLEVLNKGMRGASSSTSMFGMGLMQLGYIIDDVQYGFHAVVNNVAPFTYSIVASMGASTQAAMAWASGVQIASVAAYQLYNNWDRIMDSMGLGKVMTEAEEMDALAKNTKRTADETERLNKYKKEQLEIKNLLDSRSPEQEKQEKTVRGAVAALGDYEATGGQKLVKALTDSFRADGLGAKMSPDEKAELDKLRDQIATVDKPGKPSERVFINAQGGSLATDAALSSEVVQKQKQKLQQDFERRQKEIQDRINTEDADRAKKAANDAAKNPDDTRATIRRLEKNPANREIVEALKATLPENVMAKNVGMIFGKMQDVGRKALDHFFDEDKKKRIKATNEEQDFDENARNVFKQAVNEAKGMIPGADKMAELATMQSMLTGDPGSVQAAKARIQAELEKQGMNKGVSSGAADSILKDAEGNVKEDVINELMKERPEKSTQSQQFDAMELAARVQAGVGGDIPKKQLTVLEEMKKSLAIIEKQKGNAPFGVEE